jgi:hypothetical protein
MAGLVDYAGLFPPAALPMKTSVDNFDGYRRIEHAWMLNRFVVSVARFDTFRSAFEQLPGLSEREAPWKLSAIVGVDAELDIAAIVDFNRHTFPRGKVAVIESLEMKATDPGTIRRLADMVPKEFESYFEIPFSGMTEDFIRAIAEVGSSAKLRAGGDNAQMYPSCRDVARFLVACASAGVPFKASAGLHHALRSIHRYTYAPDSPSGAMHGFLNLFVAAAFARQGMNAEGVENVLAEQAGEAFRFENTGIGWHNDRITNEELTAARKSFCLSFGSCSFDEPIDDLRVLGLL